MGYSASDREARRIHEAYACQWEKGAGDRHSYLYSDSLGAQIVGSRNRTIFTNPARRLADEHAASQTVRGIKKCVQPSFPFLLL